jgi:hypothetical protein
MPFCRLQPIHRQTDSLSPRRRRGPLLRVVLAGGEQVWGAVEGALNGIV